MLLSGAAGATRACKTPTGICPERRHGFQLRMGDAEQYGSPRCMFFKQGKSRHVPTEPRA